MPGALAPARPGQVIAVSRRGILVLVACAVFAVLALMHWQSAGGPQSAIAAHLAGVAAEDAAYPRLATAMRSRAWLSSGPWQPEGVALFVDLPDAVFGPQHIVTPADLRQALRRIRGLAWDPAARAWIGDGRRVEVAEVRTLLAAAVPTPTEAEAIIDLLVGTPAPGAPRFAALLAADPPTLQRIRLAPFHGNCGRMMEDRGRPPYVAVERSYRGLVAAFDGVGWPDGWRVLSLRSRGP